MIEYNINDNQRKRINILKMVFAIFVVMIHSETITNDIPFANGNFVIETTKLIKTIIDLVSTNISGCAVDGFFVISAILLYRKEFNWFDNIKKKIRTLVIPYFLFNTLYVVVYAIFQNLELTKNYFGHANRIILDLDLFGWIDTYGIGYWGPINGPMWFIRNLFILNVLSIVIKKSIDRFPKTMLLVVFISKYCFSYLFFPENLLFWSLGYYIVKYKYDINYLDKKSKQITIIYIAMLFVFTILDIYNIKFVYCIDMTMKIIRNIVSIVFWYNVFTKNVNGRIQKILYKYSEFNFNIFALHGIILLFLCKLTTRILPMSNITILLGYFLLPLITIIIIVLISKIWKKISIKTYNIFNGNR